MLFLPFHQFVLPQIALEVNIFQIFGGNFESNRGAWLSYDAVEIIKDTKSCIPILIDQGTDDEFLKDQLKTELIEQVISGKDLPVKLRYQKGYDHSYFFISSFIGEHIKFHSKHLKAGL